MMPLKESAVPSRLAHDLRRKRVLGYEHRIRLSRALEGVEFHLQSSKLVVDHAPHRDVCT